MEGVAHPDPDCHSAVMLVAARVRHMAAGQWGAGCHRDAKRFAEQSAEERHGLVR